MSKGLERVRSSLLNDLVGQLVKGGRLRLVVRVVVQVGIGHEWQLLDRRPPGHDCQLASVVPYMRHFDSALLGGRCSFHDERSSARVLLVGWVDGKGLFACVTVQLRMESAPRRLRRKTKKGEGREEEERDPNKRRVPQEQGTNNIEYSASVIDMCSSCR